MFYAYGSKDFLVDESDSEELAMHFGGDHYVSFLTKIEQSFLI